MSTYTLVRWREDGLYDVLATFNADTPDEEMNDTILNIATKMLEGFHQEDGDTTHFRLVEREDAPKTFDAVEFDDAHGGEGPGYGLIG